jgi:CMP-N,N'-diacetyllegionaminic acid synthase
LDNSLHPRVLGIIPARGNSKRVPRKNIRNLCGKPLIRWTIEAANAADKLTEYVVSTEDYEIGQVAASLGCHVVRRPDDLAGDEVTSGAVCKHALEWMGADNYDLVALLHPSSPIRDWSHIDQAIDTLWASDLPCLASVACRKRTYTHNASIYLIRRDWLLKTGQHYCDQSLPFLMDFRHSVDIDTEDDFKIAELVLADLIHAGVGHPSSHPSKTRSRAA